MAPILTGSDDILVVRGDCGARLRDGIYVLRTDDALVVDRLALHPVTRRITVQWDNPAYANRPDCGIDEMHCIGPGDLGRTADSLGSPLRQPQEKRKRGPGKGADERPPVGLAVKQTPDESDDGAEGDQDSGGLG